MIRMNPKKRPRVANNNRYSVAGGLASSTSALIDSISDRTVSETTQKIRRTSSHPQLLSSSASSAAADAATTTTAISFNDASTADVLLRLFLDPSIVTIDGFSGSVASSVPEQRSDVRIYLHSDVICRAKYFSALLSDRWQRNNNDEEEEEEEEEEKGSSEDSGGFDVKLKHLNYGVPLGEGSVDRRIAVLKLLYTDDFPSVISTAVAALDLLPVALDLLFEDCVAYCVRFLEAVPWSEEEERRVLQLVPFLRENESKELLARVSAGKSDSCAGMLERLISAASIHNQPNLAFVKAFVAKLLRDFSSRDAARTALEKAFQTTLRVVKGSLEEYSSPEFRGNHYETEAIQRLNLHTAMTNGKHLVWIVERMVELRVADKAVKEWSEQSGFTADLQRAFRDDAWRNIVPGLPALVLRCTCKLASEVAAGAILAARQVRMNLVQHWLPVLVLCKDDVFLMLPGHKSLFMELEQTFLMIISTLPMSDAQELLQQCLSFSTRNVEDCPHLTTAFNTWFRRAARPLQDDRLG